MTATAPQPAPIAASAGAPLLHLTQVLVSYEDAVRLLRIRDTYDWHQRVWQAFGGRDGSPRDFLTRVDRLEEGYRLLIVSATEPHKPDWCPTHCFHTKLIPDAFFGHAHYRFSLLANPTKKIRSNKAGERTKHGRRVPLGRREDLVAWLLRKAESGCFRFDPAKLRTIPRGREYFHKPGANGLHSAVEFQGILEVTNPPAFRETFARGIGSAKAFGFGLLVLAPLSAGN
ncbi:MAG: type I-E CRISPR-associated protein Cas6/Cse3/CasE [Verrucomicrobia bacterium]|nr:type I-E CRISPR-associated protein Cas6/Cse3/CasE [Verrucomicrobiota bacterium]